MNWTSIHETLVIDDSITGVDERMLPYIYKFYEKNLLPIYSCEGHPEREIFVDCYLLFSFKKDKIKAKLFQNYVKNSFSNITVECDEWEDHVKVIISTREKITSLDKYPTYKENIKRKEEFFNVLDELLKRDLSKFEVENK